ncbi:MAG TPA: hypothetical protein VEU11_08245 [Terriglobales bacterium]|nr:hypothetical protein [Terriglobales bacterium]
MNCAEFQEILPEVLEGVRTPEQELHLKSCPLCSGLVADLDVIAREARQLQEVAEPSPRVWNSIEITLRQEGIIRDPRVTPLLVPSRPRPWSLGWLAPVAALVLVGFGIVVYQRGPSPQLSARVDSALPAAVSTPQTMQKPSVNEEDDQLLAAVASRSPAMKAQYASNLQNVNAYIRDAEESAQADPNDEEAQQIVMDAYEQRAAVYEMALDRSLP